MGRFIFVTLSLLVVAFSINGAKGCCCPEDWLPMNGFCYKVFEDHKNWSDAEMFCRKHKPGCHLASIHGNDESLEVAEYVSDYLKSGGNVWIGLNDPQKVMNNAGYCRSNGDVHCSSPEVSHSSQKRGWYWTDRSQSNYWSWQQGKPNDVQNNENCVELWSQSGYKNWNDENGASTRAYLCQYRL